MPADFNVDQWPLSPSEEGPPLTSHKGKGRARDSFPPNVDNASHSTAVPLPKRAAKSRPVASLLISVMGQLPQPLGKTAVLSLYQP